MSLFELVCYMTMLPIMLNCGTDKKRSSSRPGSSHSDKHYYSSATKSTSNWYSSRSKQIRFEKTLIRMEHFLNLYRTLGVSRNASPAQILQARDRKSTAAKGDKALLRKIKEAYEVLIDPQRRAAYDREISDYDDEEEDIRPSRRSEQTGRNGIEIGHFANFKQPPRRLKDGSMFFKSTDRWYKQALESGLSQQEARLVAIFVNAFEEGRSRGMKPKKAREFANQYSDQGYRVGIDGNEPDDFGPGTSRANPPRTSRAGSPSSRRRSPPPSRGLRRDEYHGGRKFSNYDRAPSPPSRSHFHPGRRYSSRDCSPSPPPRNARGHDRDFLYRGGSPSPLPHEMFSTSFGHREASLDYGPLSPAYDDILAEEGRGDGEFEAKYGKLPDYSPKPRSRYGTPPSPGRRHGSRGYASYDPDAVPANTLDFDDHYHPDYEILETPADENGPAIRAMMPRSGSGRRAGYGSSPGGYYHEDDGPFC